MDRVEASEAVCARLLGENDRGLAGNDPELMTILRRYIFGDTFALGDLDERTRELITIVLLTTLFVTGASSTVASAVAVLTVPVIVVGLFVMVFLLLLVHRAAKEPAFAGSVSPRPA